MSYCPSSCRRGYAGCGLIMLLLIGGCSTVPAPPLLSPQEAERQWQARQAELLDLNRFTIAGRLGIQSDQEGWHVSLRWQQDGEHFHMLFSAPLGQGSAQLEGDEREVTLTAADGRRWVAANAESLVAQVIGTPLPVTGLRYWVRGVPAPDSAATHGLDGQGRLQWLEQAGWRIAYRAYQTVEGRELPSKLFMENAQYKVRLVVDTWTLS